MYIYIYVNVLLIQDQKPGAVAEHAETKTNGSEVQVPSENTHLHQLSIQKTPGQEKTKDDEKNDKQDEPQAPVAPASVSYLSCPQSFSQTYIHYDSI